MLRIFDFFDFFTSPVFSFSDNCMKNFKCCHEYFIPRLCKFKYFALDVVRFAAPIFIYVFLFSFSAFSEIVAI